MADVKGIFKDTYLFYTKYHNNLRSDDDWTGAVDESKELYKKYPCQVYQDIIFGVINQLEREMKLKES